MTQTMKPGIAIIEDDGVLAFMMDESCKSAGYEVVGCATTGAQALELIRKSQPSILILDFNLDGDQNGLELIGEVKQINPDIKSILVTGWDINDIASRVDATQPDRILRKPVKPHVLLEVIDHVLNASARERDPSSAPVPGGIPGRSH